MPIKFGCEELEFIWWNKFGWSWVVFEGLTSKNHSKSPMETDYRKGWLSAVLICSALRFTSKVALPAEMQSGPPGTEVIHGHPWSSRPKLIRKSMVALWYPLVICYRLRTGKLPFIDIYSGFTHEKCWFSIVMLVYQRVNLYISCGTSPFLKNHGNSLK